MRRRDPDAKDSTVLREARVAPGRSAGVPERVRTPETPLGSVGVAADRPVRQPAQVESSAALRWAAMRSAAMEAPSAAADAERLWEDSSELLATATFDGFLTAISASWERTLGHSREELMSQPYLDLVHPDDVEQTIASAGALLDPAHPAVQFENRCRAKDGSYRSLDWSARTSGYPPVIHFVVRDVTAARSGARELQTTLELLREGFEDAAVGMTVTDAGSGAILRVNRAMRELSGHPRERLAGGPYLALVHPDDARASADGLAALAAGQLDFAESDERLLRADGSTVWIHRSAMALRDADGAAAGLLVAVEDISERRRREEAAQREIEEAAWIERIRDALDHERLVLLAQPIISLRTRAVVQHEMLLRMIDPLGALIPPMHFLPAAEHCGLVEELDAWVISHGARYAARGDTAVEINLSAASIGNLRILAHIERELIAHGVDPAKLVFEITETALMVDIARGAAFAERLSALGCRFALDDFGTGFGSFTYLKHLAAHYLKIDREFVANARDSERDRHVIKAIVALATGFGQETIAEGVEDEETAVMLTELGVDFAQGFHIGRPAPQLAIAI